VKCCCDVFSACWLWVVDVIKVDVMVLKVCLFLNYLYVDILSYVILTTMPQMYHDACYFYECSIRYSKPLIPYDYPLE
jgi:hypothetical protein